MITYEELEEMLDQIAYEIPRDFFKELNGGIVLSPNSRMHPESSGKSDLYILGEYHNDRRGVGGLGRYIIIYYGSFSQLYANHPYDIQRKRLRDVLIHEFTHHLESLAGERDLEIKDKEFMEKYRLKTGL